MSNVFVVESSSAHRCGHLLDDGIPDHILAVIPAGLEIEFFGYPVGARFHEVLEDESGPLMALECFFVMFLFCQILLSFADALAKQEQEKRYSELWHEDWYLWQRYSEFVKVFGRRLPLTKLNSGMCFVHKGVIS